MCFYCNCLSIITQHVNYHMLGQYSLVQFGLVQSGRFLFASIQFIAHIVNKNAHAMQCTCSHPKNTNIHDEHVYRTSIHPSIRVPLVPDESNLSHQFSCHKETNHKSTHTIISASLLLNYCIFIDRLCCLLVVRLLSLLSIAHLVALL